MNTERHKHGRTFILSNEMAVLVVLSEFKT
jgi:hypothetical protein